MQQNMTLGRETQSSAAAMELLQHAGTAWESCINPLLWIRLSLPPTPHHCDHPSFSAADQGGEVTRGQCLTGVGTRFIGLSCFFCCEKGKSITLTRKGAGVALHTWEQRHGPLPKPSLNSFLPKVLGQRLTSHRRPPNLLGRLRELQSWERAMRWPKRSALSCTLATCFTTSD